MTTEKKSGPKAGKSLAMVQGGLLALATMLVYLVVEQMVLKPAAEQVQDSVRQLMLNTAAQHAGAHLQHLREATAALSVQVQGAAPDVALAAEAELAVPASLPSLKRLVSRTQDAFQRDAHPDYPISYTGMNLLNAAAEGRVPPPEAARSPSGKWHFQVAAPIREVAASGQTGEKVTGAVLAFYDIGPLQASLQGWSVGRVELVQTSGGQATVVLSNDQADNGSGYLAAPLADSEFEIRLQSGGPLPVSSEDSTLLIVFAVAAVLLGALAAAGPLLAARRAGPPKAPGIGVPLATAAESFRPAREGEAQVDPAAGRHARVVSGRDAGQSRTGVPAAQVSEADPVTGAESIETQEEAPLFGEDEPLDLFGQEAEGGGLDAGMGIGEVAHLAMNPDIFRAYDIRGVADRDLTVEVMTELGKALGSEALARGAEAICVGRDARLSSKTLTEALISGLLSTGLSVVDLGQVATPVLWFATHFLKTGTGAMVTGSHNPAAWNGLKMMVAEASLQDEDIQILRRRIETRNYASGRGVRNHRELEDAYVERVVSDIAIAAPLKVVVDAGNGVAGPLACRLFEDLGCEVVPLNCEPDGHFPAHAPDPGQPENLAQLIEKVRAEQADLGIAFDGDGDRLGMVTESGKIIWPDRLLMLFVQDVVSRNPGADVVFDVKCSRHVAAVVSRAGGRPIMSRTGHSVIKTRMRETGALIGGELSGHIFFSERWYGFDDGIYSAARLLEILGMEGRPAGEVFAGLPEDISTPELSAAVGEQEKFSIVQAVQENAQWGEATVSTIDGIRVEYPDGWGLCRASNTTPALTFRFEAEDQAALERIQEIFRQRLHSVRSDLALPF